MGKYDDAMYLYLSDNERFADLFNGVLFGGEKVLCGDMLEPAPERYVDMTLQEDPKDSVAGPRQGDGKCPGATGPQYTVTRLPQSYSGFRDIKKRLRTGEGFVVTAIENQNDIDYTMPWRIMRYDQMEYGRQIRDIRKGKRAARKAQGLPVSGWTERLEQGEGLHPVYTICFYHGTEKWNGPRSLRDMMEFGEGTEAWQQCFQNYGMNLFCADAPGDLERFGTELRQLLKVLPLRQDKEALSELWSQEEFSHLDRETIETIAILTDNTEILDKLERYEKEGGYNMCLAVDEMRREWKAEGKAEGMANQIILIIDSIMEKLQCSLEEACEIAGKVPEEYQQAKKLQK